VQAAGHTHRLVEACLAKPNDMYFVATVQRSAVTVTVHVTVGDDYPASKPLMAVSLQWAGVLRTALNDEAIRVCRLTTLLHTYTMSGCFAS